MLQRFTLATALLAAACGGEPSGVLRVSGHVEATDIQVSAEVGGRLEELRVQEGDRVAAGDLIARVGVVDTTLRLQQVRAERRHAEAQLQLLQAGSRDEDIRQADAQIAAAAAEAAAARAELSAAETDYERFEALL